MAAFNVFKELQDDRCYADKDDPIENCNSLKRLSVALKIYTKMDLIHNQLHQNMFIQFITTIYCSFLNDYNHLIIDHQNDLQTIHEAISNQMGICNIKKCTFTSRHFDFIVDKNDTEKPKDPKLYFYKQSMDSLHYYLFHLYDTGMRIKKLVNDNKDEQKHEITNKSAVDFEFKRIFRVISERKHIGLEFDRFKANNKFNIAASATTSDNNDQQETSSVTYLDVLFKTVNDYMYDDTKIYIPTKSTRKFKQYIKDEQYDSETLLFDITQISNSNIKKQIDNKNLLSIITQFIAENSLSSGSFQVGCTFYYWDYYKNKEKNMFIDKKYSTFKEEITNYKHLGMDIYESVVVPKVKEYIDTKKARLIWANIANEDDDSNAVKLYYGVKIADRISFNHLLSLTLYTDHSKLCTDFSSTFRAVSNYDVLDVIKQKNSRYFWMSKYLRETVQIFGDDGRSHLGEVALSGPFFCGLSVKLHLPEFQLRLCSPTSTSTQISVAARFAGEAGTLIQMNNSVSGQTSLHGFKCDWISTYKEEAEVLYFGGHYKIQVEMIMSMETNKMFRPRDIIPFKNIIEHLGDILLYGAGKYTVKNEKVSFKKIKTLINLKLSKNADYIDKYIYEKFLEYADTKREIRLRLCDLYNPKKSAEEKQIVRLLFHEEDGSYQCDLIQTEKHSSNLFSPNLLKLFTNLEFINIYCHSYHFSLLYLLSLIQNTSIKKLTMHSNGVYPANWIRKLWSIPLRFELEQKYQEKGFVMTRRTGHESSTGRLIIYEYLDIYRR